MFIEGSTHKYSKQILNALPRSSYERYYILNGSLYPVGGQTVSLVQSSKLREYIHEVASSGKAPSAASLWLYFNSLAGGRIRAPESGRRISINLNEFENEDYSE